MPTAFASVRVQSVVKVFAEEKGGSLYPLLDRHVSQRFESERKAEKQVKERKEEEEELV